MAPVNLYDKVTIAVASGPLEIILSCDDSTVPADETNLAFKAAALLCAEVGTQAKITLSLRKRIPAGAGLGGGSSDAAAVLKGLNSALTLGLTEAQLCALAVRLGADVPFFISCRPACASGIGEVLTPAPVLPLHWLVLVVPQLTVSTPWAYRRFDEIQPTALPLPPLAVEISKNWPATHEMVNDLEQAVFPVYPQIAHLKDRLVDLGADRALMSGSGSAVFGVFSCSVTAEQAQAALQDRGKAFLVQTLTCAPVDFSPERC
jgi:4-diphosphocytidyl-2-C-methyl-D-erythritol kinase